MKSEIQRRLEEAEGMIRMWKEEANKRQSEANRREERLRLLKKEGEYKNTTNTTITTWMVISVVLYTHSPSRSLTSRPIPRLFLSAPLSPPSISLSLSLSLSLS